MINLAQQGKELEDALRLKTKIIAYRKLGKASELEAITDIQRIDHYFSFCQVPFLVRVNGWTLGITKDDKVNLRCARLFGLKPATEESMNEEATMLSTTWFRSPEEALIQQKNSYRIPVGEAIVLAPLTKEKFEPDTLLIYGNPAQIMMIMCSLQKDKYERFSFSFIGEGSCSDALAQCYVTGKLAVSIPCYGERAQGCVADDEIVVALPPADLERVITVLQNLSKVGFNYPISVVGPVLDPTPVLTAIYSSVAR